MSWAFRGVTFTRVLSSQEVGAEEELQESEYNGIDGVEAVRLGQRKSTFALTGWLIAADESTLHAAKEAIRALADGVAGTLTDHGSNSYQYCIMRAPRFFNRRATNNGIEEDYALTFEKLGPND